MTPAPATLELLDARGHLLALGVVSASGSASFLTGDLGDEPDFLSLTPPVDSELLVFGAFPRDRAGAAQQDLLHLNGVPQEGSLRYDPPDWAAVSWTLDLAAEETYSIELSRKDTGPDSDLGDSIFYALVTADPPGPEIVDPSSAQRPSSQSETDLETVTTSKGVR